MLRHTRRLLIYAAFAAIVATGLTACRSDGPLEKAGEAVDDAADDIADVFDG